MEEMPCLYVGVAEPLIENANVWLAKVPSCASEKELDDKLKAFPFREMGAYGIQMPESKEPAIVFHTNADVPKERIEECIREWSGSSPSFLSPVVRPIPSLDYRACLAALVRSLDGSPVRVVTRVGLTLQSLQRDLATLKPSVVVLDCHGTEEGCLILEDGRGQGDFVGGERVLAILRPAPRVLFLSACYSERVLDRVGEAGIVSDAAIVYIRGSEPLEATAGVAFAGMFFPAIYRGEAAGEAFEAAREYVRNDPQVGRFSAAPGKVTPADKLLINEAGRDVRLAVPPASEEKPAHVLPPALAASTLPRRSAERFIGRRREMRQVLDLLLPLPAGIVRGSEAGDHRLVTLTKEGGIGKTALAIRVVEWLAERRLFAAIAGIGCETFTSADELLSALLAMLGVAPAQQKGDLLALLRTKAGELPLDQAVLIVLDNLDDLAGQDATPEVRRQTAGTLETLLDAAPTARLLCTCRWPLGMGNYETVWEVPPMAEEEARDVFLAHLQSPAHQFEVRENWKEREGPARKPIVELAGCHPLSLYLLARQLDGVAGTTLARLAEEAEECLLEKLRDPHVAQDATAHRHASAEATFELSCRHLSEPAARLFERLSQLPDGVWCGPIADDFVDWKELFGENWREYIEKLDYFGLVHFEPDRELREHGAFVMLPPIRRFAGERFLAADDKQWQAKSGEFWEARASAWDDLLSGRIPEGVDLADEQRAEASQRSHLLANIVFERNDANIRAAFEQALRESDVRLAKTLLLDIVDFTNLCGHRLRLREMTERAVSLAREEGSPEQFAPLLGTLGNVLRDLGEREGARDAFQEALEIRRRLAAQHPAAFEQYVAATLNNLGTVLSDLGDREGARDAYQEALPIYRRLAEQHPAAFEPDVAMTLNNMGTVLGALGEREGAQRCYREAVEIFKPLAKKWPAAFGERFAGTLSRYVQVAPESGDDPWWTLWKRLRNKAKADASSDRAPDA